ncbi:MAG: LptF/LptG family permease [Campylobacterales bacterium]|nr:LptF/LptG family permease [Campylobacterales bacterium]
MTLFIPLFFVISLVYVVKIAALTHKIEIDLAELLQMFSYFIPMILFYTLPISFIAAVSSMFFRLSIDNELVALFSLGVKSSYIVRIISYIAVALTTILLFLSLIIMPQSKHLFNQFKNNKLKEARLNIIPNQLGQKFGNFYIYLKSKEQNSLKDIVVYNRDEEGNNQIFIASQGKIKDENGLFSLELYEGRGYTYDYETLKEIEYAKMSIFDSVEFDKINFQNSMLYWSGANENEGLKQRLLVMVFTSLIPILSLYIIVAFSIINPRYQSNRSFLVIASIATTFYLLATLIKREGIEIYFTLAVVTSVVAGIYLFRKRIGSFY